MVGMDPFFPQTFLQTQPRHAKSLRLRHPVQDLPTVKSRSACRSRGRFFPIASTPHVLKSEVTPWHSPNTQFQPPFASKLKASATLHASITPYLVSGLVPWFRLKEWEASPISQRLKARFVRLPQEPEDAKLTGDTRSLDRRLLGLNLGGSLTRRVRGFVDLIPISSDANSLPETQPPTNMRWGFSFVRSRVGQDAG